MIIFGFLFGGLGFIFFTKPRENQKTKTFWRSFGFRSKDIFFLFSLNFFVIFLNLDFFFFFFRRKFYL